MVHPTNILFSLSVDRILVWIITYTFANRFIFCLLQIPLSLAVYSCQNIIPLLCI